MPALVALASDDGPVTFDETLPRRSDRHILALDKLALPRLLVRSLIALDNIEC